MNRKNTEFSKGKVTLLWIFQLLYRHFGPQYWWPGDGPFEVMVGAILTQNTNWGNVERAIDNLKKACILEPQKIETVSEKTLASLIRPAGYYNIKAKRLKNFVSYFVSRYRGSVNRMKKMPLEKLREELLAIKGIGPETADSILLYALEKPVFVVDAYTKRVLYRHGLIERPNEDYHHVQMLFHGELKRDVQLYNEYHALFVRVGKEHCRPKPLCKGCPLSMLLK
ncbi:MAG: endonuclease III domain-containing protein [Nitrospirae bacterium]|nr:MAG: endonuclease III domain-containing protein [Nitrospirota bacterium]